MFVRLAAGLVLALMANGVLAQDATAEADGDEDAALSEREAAASAAAAPLLQQLRSSTAPRDWMLASQLQFLAPDEPAAASGARAELLRNAAAAAPDDILVQWIAMTSTPSADGGCSAPAGLPANMDAVLRLDGDNGLAWLPVLEHASRENDELGMDAALARMAAARRYDDHVDDYTRLLVPLFKAHPALAEAVLGDEDSPGDPAFLAFMYGSSADLSAAGMYRACREDGDNSLSPRRRALCADVSQRLMREGRSSGTRLQGQIVLKRLGELDQDEVKTAEREQMWLLWSLEQSGAEKDPALVAEMMYSLNDMEALRRLAQSRGLPLKPPAFWQLPQEYVNEFDEDNDAEAPDATDEDKDSL